MTHLHLAQLAYNQAHLIHGGKLQVILDFLETRTGISAPLIASTVPEAAILQPPRRGASMRRIPLSASMDVIPIDDIEPADTAEELQGDSIAVISITGTLVNRIAMEPISSFASYERITGMVNEAAADSSVRGILLRVESFGGEVSGAFDAADAIARATAKKPTWTAIDDNAFSAGYLLPSQTGRIHLTRTGGAGSIGVIAVHYDISEAEKMAGIKPTVITFGAKKDQFSPEKPLDKEATAWLKAEVNRWGNLFVDYAARGRGLDRKAVLGQQAGIFTGEDAVAAGLADGVATFRETLSEFASYLNSGAVSTSQPAAKAAAKAKETEIMEQVETPAVQVESAAPEIPAPPQAGAALPAVTAEDVDRIIALCTIAGKPHLIQAYRDKNATVAEVQTELLKAKAAEAKSEEVIINATPNETAKGGEKEPDLMSVINAVYNPTTKGAK